MEGVSFVVGRVRQYFVSPDGFRAGVPQVSALDGFFDSVVGFLLKIRIVPNGCSRWNFSDSSGVIQRIALFVSSFVQGFRNPAFAFNTCKERLERLVDLNKQGLDL